MLERRVSEREIAILKIISYCGEAPREMLAHFYGCVDYNRRLVTRLVKDGYLKERKFVTKDRRVVRSWSLSAKGAAVLERFEPAAYKIYLDHLFCPGDGRGDQGKTFRLHRHTHGMLSAATVNACWQPEYDKERLIGKRRVYYSAYEWNRRFERDSKGSRAVGVLFGRDCFYPLYYLGDKNLRWDDAVEEAFFDHVAAVVAKHRCGFSGCILVGKTWSLGGSILAHGINRHTNLIPIKDGRPLFYIADDYFGHVLLECLLHDNFSLLERNVQSYTREEDQVLDYEFDLSYLSRYCKTDPRTRFFAPGVSYVFPFQLDVLQNISRLDTEFRPLPIDLLRQTKKEFRFDE